MTADCKLEIKILVGAALILSFFGGITTSLPDLIVPIIYVAGSVACIVVIFALLNRIGGGE